LISPSKSLIFSDDISISSGGSEDVDFDFTSVAQIWKRYSSASRVSLLAESWVAWEVSSLFWSVRAAIVSL
jgi:hypothetical protein